MAVLGCSESVDVYITDRSGKDHLFSVPHTRVSWERVLDDTSKATIEVKGKAGREGSDCCDQLEDVRSWANEVVIYRNSARVWAGPVAGMVFDEDGVTIEAQDISAWLGERRIHGTHVWEKADLSLIYQRLAEDAMAVDNVPGMIVRSVPSKILGDRTVKKDQFRMADKELDELARDGVDWTCIDRVLWCGGEADVAGTPSFTLTDAHIVSKAKITEHSDIVTDQTVIGAGNEEEGPTIWGTAMQNNPTILDTYGIHEHVVTEDKIRDAQSAVGAAQSRLDAFKEPPVVFSGGELSDDAPVALADLVPGVLINVQLLDYCRRINDNYFLTKVSAEHGPEDDSISVELSPANVDAEDES